MAADGRRLKPHAEARIRTVIGGISGVTILRLVERDDLGESRLVAITLKGWSPSLNVFTMMWNAVVDGGQDAETQAKQVLDELEPNITMQRQRLEEGLTLGTAAPFGVCSMNGSGGRADTKWGHILIDRGLAALMEGTRAGMGSEISDSVFDMHQSDQGERDGLESRFDGDATDDNCDPLGRHALHGRVLTHDVPLGSGSFYDGERLLVSERIPETLLLAVTGRMLGELVEVPPAIAYHIVTGGESVGDGTSITVEPRLATATQLLAEIDAGGIKLAA